MADTTDLLIIGGGCAGLTAAIYAIRAGLSATVLEGGFAGGQIAVTNEIENYPGYVKISGPDLAMKIYEQAQRLGADIQMEQVVKASLASPVKTLQTNGGEYKGKSVIIANGVKRRTLDCPGEKELTGKGVSHCATCDGAFFRGKVAAVIGGGNTALEDALFLSNLCESVFLIHRRNAFRGEKLLADVVKKRKNIIFHGETVVKEILGEKAVTAAVIRNINSGQEELLPVSAVFIAIGLVPDNRIFSELPLDSNGYILAGDDCKTSLAGVFAAGDTRAKALRQILTAASDGATAAFQAASYVNTLETALR